MILKNGRLESRKVIYIRPAQITPNPSQPRRIFDPESLRELADSIRQYGVLQPLTVRKLGSGAYELVAGERRLRASRMAGLPEIPCLVIGASEKESALLALIENLQRRDLDFFEEAQGYARLIENFRLSQEDAARRLGKSQSAIANKLRLLKLGPDIVHIIRSNALTERHARALLRLHTDTDRIDALTVILNKKLNVSQTDELVEAMLAPKESMRPEHLKTLFIVKDVRVFLNTVSHAVDVMRTAGVNAVYNKEETETDITLTVSIPKHVVPAARLHRA